MSWHHTTTCGGCVLDGLCDGVFGRFFLGTLAKEKLASERPRLLLTKENYFRNIDL